MFFRFGVLALATAIVSGCESTTGSASSDVAVVRRISIASSIPNAYGTVPCSFWSMAGERSMRGYQLRMRPLDVFLEMPRELRTAENVETLRHVMSNVTVFKIVNGDDAKVFVGERYANLVAEECQAIRAR